MDRSEKKTCYRNIQLPGGFASFPGAQEVSSISGSLLDDPGGITFMGLVGGKKTLALMTFSLALIYGSNF